ncbi:MAG: glycosyltransferase family 4 protein [Desulfobacterales bacterium]|uniref:Glycosyltransferase family 4 protein n=1 Tax=Candidatus Desulfatibia vada TaxID=2841696 RepID=A0A8J6P467_9BACT|nr:glycosyltransferase family 4 protein [Candidatus Desulfatibia vada]
MENLTIAVQYPSFGPQHPPRLRAIVRSAPNANCRVVAMEMFAKDSDYEWDPVLLGKETFERYTVMDCESAVGRRNRSILKKTVFKALDDIRPDVLVVNGWGHRESRISLAWCRKEKCKIVMLSDSVRDNFPRYFWKETYKKWLLRGIQAGFAAGTPQARYLNRLGIPLEGIFYPGSTVVDNEYWTKKKRQIVKDKEKLRLLYGLPERFFLCVARFVDFKNIPFLIRSYAAYRSLAGQQAIGLVLCGSGPQEGKIIKTIKNFNLKEVYLVGFRQASELPVFYGLADCFIFPSSRFEPWGLVANEAMASGLPILASSMTGCAEDLVHDEVNGFVFDPEDENGLADIMFKITQDQHSLAQKGRESEKIIAAHSPEAGAINFWKAVQTALGRPQSVPH